MSAEAVMYRISILARKKSADRSGSLRTIVLALLIVLTVPFPAQAQSTRAVTLYFPGEDGRFLEPEKREVELGPDLSGQARIIILALMEGPRTNLEAALRPNARLRQVYVDAEGIAYLDLAEETVRDSNAGVAGERLSLWSLVNSLCLNLEEIKAVKVLIGGAEVPTFMGHIDISYPLYPDSSLIKPVSSEENDSE